MGRILVTGSEGFIGSHVAQLLRDNGLDVFTMDLVGEGNKHTVIDLTSADLESYVNSLRPEVIIHLAAQVDVVASFKNPRKDLYINGIGTLELLLAARRAGTKKFVFVGSGGAIYDSNSSMPVDEKAKTNPISPYGLSKLLAEGYVRIFCEEFEIEWVSLALSNCYGDVRRHGRGVIHSFYTSLINGQSPIINGADVTRDFVHVDDVARAVLLAIAKTPNCRVNISSNSEVSLFDLFSQVANILGKDNAAEIRPAREGDVLRSRLDNRRAKELINWVPEINLASGLRRSILGENRK
jgi:UDP-glucose 4-epimerase